jgi:hypothetical protein
MISTCVLKTNVKFNSVPLWNVNDIKYSVERQMYIWFYPSVFFYVCDFYPGIILLYNHIKDVLDTFEWVNSIAFKHHNFKMA